jgi:acid phosphatase family membrane protein YuiD
VRRIAVAAEHCFCDNFARHMHLSPKDFMDYAYLITPFLTWLVVGPIKFLINSARQRRWAFNLVGNGGFPSNHSSVVTSMATLIALREGIGHPAFGVAVTLAFIVMIDANSLRQHVGRQAAAINQHAAALNRLALGAANHKTLRERMGHTLVEICGGIATGIGMGFLVFNLFGG